MTSRPSRQVGHSPRLGALAVLTPPGRGGIAVIRCIGYVAQTALLRCFRPPADRKPSGHAPGALPAPGTLAYGHLVDKDGSALDEIILYNASQQPEPPETSGVGGMPTRRCVGMRTGQDPSPSDTHACGTAPQACHPEMPRMPVFEINCHGGPVAVQAVCDRLTGLGLEAVDADRLMELEGLPLLERQARCALRGAPTPLTARILLDQLNGALAVAVAGVIGNLKAGRTDAARAGLETLLARWDHCGRHLANPPRIVIAGRPNSGKSTLLNRLVAAERAITSPVPGTTRDYVEAEAALEGMPVVLVDTAGLRPFDHAQASPEPSRRAALSQSNGREAAGAIERQGVDRARAELARADVVIYLVDAAEGLLPEDEAVLSALGGRAILVWNKIDVAQDNNKIARPGRPFIPLPKVGEGRVRGLTDARQDGVPPRNHCSLSALTGQGIDTLVHTLLDHLGWRPPSPGKAVPFTEDQAQALSAARNSLASGDPAAAASLLSPLLA
jgi:tRNA modification GTPase